MENLTGIFTRTKIFGLIHLVFLFTTILSLTVYNNARFDPTGIGYMLNSQPLINSVNACLCECFNNVTCSTTTYLGINQTCILFSAQLNQGQLRVVPSIINAKVYYFGNRNVGTSGK